MAAEGDESDSTDGLNVRRHVADNSVSRLLALSDGVFAIAMTLLSLDLKVPSLGDHPSNATLQHALAANSGSYWSYLITFYVVANYWMRHRRLLKSVVRDHPDLTRDTLLLLLFVAAMPFPATLLGQYGGNPISLLLYGAINAAATLTLILTSWDVRRLGLADGGLDPRTDYLHSRGTWRSLVVFVICMPAGYLLGSYGPTVLILLALPDRVSLLSREVRRIRHRNSTPS